MAQNRANPILIRDKSLLYNTNRAFYNTFERNIFNNINNISSSYFILIFLKIFEQPYLNVFRFSYMSIPSTGSPAPMNPQKHPYPLKERGLQPVAHKMMPAK